MLKNPSHMTALDALMTVYPDALVVYTHREPVVCIASSCSLSAETTAGHSETYVGGVIGQTQLDLWSRAFHAFHDARPAYDQDQFADVAFSDLRKDPLGVTRALYEQWSLDWTPEVEAAITEIDQESKSGAAAPKHDYSLEDYGLTEEQVRARSTGSCTRTSPQPRVARRSSTGVWSAASRRSVPRPRVDPCPSPRSPWSPALCWRSSAVLLGHRVTTRRGARELDRWRKREETMRLLRWAHRDLPMDADPSAVDRRLSTVLDALLVPHPCSTWTTEPW